MKAYKTKHDIWCRDRPAEVYDMKDYAYTVRGYILNEVQFGNTIASGCVCGRSFSAIYAWETCDIYGVQGFESI